MAGGRLRSPLQGLRVDALLHPAWLGVGNVLSLALPIRDELLRKRRQSGSLKRFLIAFAVSYAIGYLVNLMLIWRVFAAQELAQRLDSVLIPAVFVILSSLAMWFLLTVFALALAQQPKIRRALSREIADYNNNAEAEAYAAEGAHTRDGGGWLLAGGRHASDG